MTLLSPTWTTEVATQVVAHSQSGPLLPTPAHWGSQGSCNTDLICSLFRFLTGFKGLPSLRAFPHAVPLACNTLAAPFTSLNLPILQVST